MRWFLVIPARLLWWMSGLWLVRGAVVAVGRLIRRLLPLERLTFIVGCCVGWSAYWWFIVAGQQSVECVDVAPQHQPRALVGTEERP